jgi:hypothetical protein
MSQARIANLISGSLFFVGFMLSVPLLGRQRSLCFAQNPRVGLPHSNGLYPIRHDLFIPPKNLNLLSAAMRAVNGQIKCGDPVSQGGDFPSVRLVAAETFIF